MEQKKEIKIDRELLIIIHGILCDCLEEEECFAEEVTKNACLHCNLEKYSSIVGKILVKTS